MDDTIELAMSLHTRRMSRRRLLRGAAVLSALCAGLALTPARADEAPVAATATLEAAYSSQTFEWLDAARGRAVPVRLYLPEAASAERPVPLVVFSHGIGGTRNGYSYLGRARPT